MTSHPSGADPVARTMVEIAAPLQGPPFTPRTRPGACFGEGQRYLGHSDAAVRRAALLGGDGGTGSPAPAPRRLGDRIRQKATKSYILDAGHGCFLGFSSSWPAFSRSYPAFFGIHRVFSRQNRATSPALNRDPCGGRGSGWRRRCRGRSCGWSARSAAAARRRPAPGWPRRRRAGRLRSAAGSGWWAG